MKIFEYVNSKDIKEYWKEIGYKPTMLESAWLIWQGKNQILDEKHASWLSILNDYEDCAVPAGFYDLPQESLHNFLKRYIELENELISAFYMEDDNAIFSYRMYFDDDGDREWYNEPALFHNFDDAYEHYHVGEGLNNSPDQQRIIKTYGRQERQEDKYRVRYSKRNGNDLSR